MIAPHVTHLLPAYAHRQLSGQRREKVARHLKDCAACRAALIREEALARELAVTLPLIGQPAPGQLRRLWPSIRAQISTTTGVEARHKRLLPSAGVLLAMLLICAFSVSSLFSGTTHVSAAPNPFVPADIRATNTPVHTDTPDNSGGSAADAPLPSQTASAFNGPMPSPAPLPVRWPK